jgi:hypothetical protein
MRAVKGFVVVGPVGVLPGTFTIDRDRALRDAGAVAILNHYAAASVRVRAAEIVVAPTGKGWGLPKPMRAKIDARVAEIRLKGR